MSSSGFLHRTGQRASPELSALYFVETIGAQPERRRPRTIDGPFSFASLGRNRALQAPRDADAIQSRVSSSVKRGFHPVARTSFSGEPTSAVGGPGSNTI